MSSWGACNQEEEAPLPPFTKCTAIKDFPGSQLATISLLLVILLVYTLLHFYQLIALHGGPE